MVPSKFINFKYNMFYSVLHRSNFYFFFKNFFFCKFLKFLLKKGLKTKIELYLLKGFLNIKVLLLNSSCFFFNKVLDKKSRKTKFFKSFKYFLAHQLFVMNLLYFQCGVKNRKIKNITFKKYRRILFQKKFVLNLFKFLIVSTF